MTDSLKSTLKHGLEMLGVCILVWGIDFFLKDVVPQLPQTLVLTILAPILASVAKNLRSNPKIPIPDWVNQPVGRARQ